jgi:hypothetical protein
MPSSIAASQVVIEKENAGGRREPQWGMEMAFMVTLYYYAPAYAFVTTANIGNFFRTTR